MVEFRALHAFVLRSQICMLMRLSTHYTVSCVASESLLPENLATIHYFLGTQLGAQGTGFRLADLMFRYANICSKACEGKPSFDEIVEWSTEWTGGWKDFLSTYLLFGNPRPSI